MLARQTREVNLLKTDPTYLETMARDRLDLMKEGETIFRLEPAEPETQLSAASRSSLRAGATAVRLVSFAHG